jgi:hypothetical protein
MVTALGPLEAVTILKPLPTPAEGDLGATGSQETERGLHTQWMGWVYHRDGGGTEDGTILSL